MSAPEPGPDPVRSLFQSGGDEEIGAHLSRYTPLELVGVLDALPEDLRTTAFRVLGPIERRDLLDAATDDQVRRLVTSLPPQLAGDLVESLDPEHRPRVFGLLDSALQAAVLREVERESARAQLLESLGDHALADIAEQQRTDDATDLMVELSEERRERVLDVMEQSRREEIEQLSAYPEESAGGLMQTELVRLPEDLTVREAVDLIRREYARLGDLHDLYVVDAAGCLKGRVRSRQLLVNRPDRLIREFMLGDLRPVPVTMDQEEIADIVQDYDLSSVPVVDAEGRLLGRILVDDILDVVEEEYTEDVTRMAGTAPADVYSRSVIRTVRARLPWLVVTFCAGLAVVLLLKHWEDTFTRRFSLLVMVIPAIMGLAGNVATQASTVTVRALAIGEIDIRRPARVLAKEVMSGLIMGVVFGGLLYVFVQFGLPLISDVDWPEGTSPAVAALIPAMAIVVNALFGAAVGTFMPMILDRLGRDPAVASSPFITTVCDIMGVVHLWVIVSLVLG